MKAKKLDAKTVKYYEVRANILKAMAHPTRLFILEQLKMEDLYVCEMHDLIEADMSTISKHLAVLKNVGLVSCEKKGLQVYYHLETPCVFNSLLCIETVIEERMKRQNVLR